MPKITVCLADANERDSVCAALRAKKYTVSILDAMAAGDNAKEAAEQLRKQKAAAVVMDYVSADALSVKTMQAATDGDESLRFIFILPVDVPRSHVFMAINEGAAAVLERPVNPGALVNYVTRAVSGPSRLRHDTERDASLARRLEEMEREAGALKMQLASLRKLVSYLMTTPDIKQPRNALVVSDSSYQRDYLRNVLAQHGFSVSMARNPEEGVQMALSEKPRIVVSDLEMEGMNGLEFCHALKITHKFVPCFFVICTANSEKVDMVMAPGNGVDGCVIKPGNESDNQELVATAAMGLLL